MEKDVALKRNRVRLLSTFVTIFLKLKGRTSTQARARSIVIKCDDYTELAEHAEPPAAFEVSLEADNLDGIIPQAPPWLLYH